MQRRDFAVLLMCLWIKWSKISHDVGAKLTEHVKEVRKERRKVSRRAESANKLAVITAIDDHITSCEQAIVFSRQ